MMAQSADLIRQSEVILKDAAVLLEDSLQLRVRKTFSAAVAAEPDKT